MATVQAPIHQLLGRIASDLDLTDEDLARALGVSAETLSLWRSDGAAVGDEAKERLAELEALHDHLGRTFTPEAVAAWLRADVR